MGTSLATRALTISTASWAFGGKLPKMERAAFVSFYFIVQ